MLPKGSRWFNQRIRPFNASRGVEGHLQGVPQNMSDFVFLHFSQQSNIKKQNLMVPSNSLLNSVHENVQKLFPCLKNNQVISIFPRGLKTPQNTSHPPWKPCLGEKGTIHLFSQLKQWLRTFFSSEFNEESDGAIKFCLRMSYYLVF